MWKRSTGLLFGKFSRNLSTLWSFLVMGTVARASVHLRRSHACSLLHNQDRDPFHNWILELATLANQPFCFLLGGTCRQRLPAGRAGEKRLQGWVERHRHIVKCMENKEVWNRIFYPGLRLYVIAAQVCDIHYH